MNRNLLRHPARSFLVTSLLVGAAFTAHAQTEAPALQPRMQAPTGQAAEATHTPRAERRERMQAHVAQRLMALKTQLALTPQQDSAWQTFAAAMQPSPDAWRQRVAMRTDLHTLTTPQRIDRMRALRSEHNAAMDQRLDATQAFYAQLSPEQQKTFDARAMTAERMGQGGHRQGMRKGKHAHESQLPGADRSGEGHGAEREGS